MTLSTLIVASALIQPRPYLLLGERSRRITPRPVVASFDANNKPFTLAADGTVRFFDNPLLDPVRLGKISETDTPQFDLTPEQKKDVADAIKAHKAMWGDIPWNQFAGLIFVPRPGFAEFGLTDRHNKIWFYSTQDGKLLRKLALKYKKPTPFAPIEFSMTDDGAYVLTRNSQTRMAYIFDGKSGSELYSFPVKIFDVPIMSATGEFYIMRNTVLEVIDLKTGKKKSPDVKLVGDECGSGIVSPDGRLIAYANYMKGQRAGSMILDLATGKSRPIDSTLKMFRPKFFTPDSKEVIMHEPRFLHFVDVATGQHTRSYNSGYPDIWDTIDDLSFSPDGKNLALIPNHAVDPFVDYFCLVDLTQKAVRKVDKIGP